MDKTIVLKELQFKAIRSSGPGGQHANKVSSKVELQFHIPASKGLQAAERERIMHKLAGKLTKDHILLLQCDEARSQHKNKALVVARFFSLLDRALHIPKKRKPSTPSKSAIEKRLLSKKKTATKKSNRQKPPLDG